MGVVLMLKWQLICHQKCVFGLLILYQLSFWYLNNYHAAKRKKLSQIYLPYNQFLLPYKRSIFTIKVAKMIWFLEKSTLYPDLPYKRLPYKWSVLYYNFVSLETDSADLVSSRDLIERLHLHNCSVMLTTLSAQLHNTLPHSWPSLFLLVASFLLVNSPLLVNVY